MEDTYKQLGIIYNPDDDTLQRLRTFPLITTEQHNSLPNQPIFTQDILLNSSHKTSLRLFKPFHPPLNTKLPLIVFIHGGGFIFASPFITLFDDFCSSMSISLNVVVLSVDYRLAPESRLPAAYEDAVEALTWVRDEADNNMLKGIVDFSNCYLMGDSAGGNIVYHAGLRAVSINLEPVVIKGYILIQPAFGGMKRTESEVRLAEDKNLSLAFTHLLWELALPKGSDRDHEYCNPMVDGSFSDKIGLLRRCFLVARGGDILVDRQKEFSKMLEDKGVEVVNWFEDDGSHGIFLEPEKALHLFEVIREFIYQPMPGYMVLKKVHEVKGERPIRCPRSVYKVDKTDNSSADFTELSYLIQLLYGLLYQQVSYNSQISYYSYMYCYMTLAQLFKPKN